MPSVQRMVLPQTIEATRQNISQALKRGNLIHPFSSLYSPGSSPTIARLKRLADLEPARFELYMRFIDELLGMKQEQKVSLQLVLHLPSLRALRGIDIERLLDHKEAHRMMVKRCYRPTDGKIDLRPLVSINRINFENV